MYKTEKGGKQSLILSNLKERASNLCGDDTYKKDKEQFIFTATEGSKKLDDWRYAFEEAVKNASVGVVYL